MNLSRIRRADERTRTAHLLITSERSGVAGACEFRIGNGFSVPVLHIIAGYCVRVRVKPGSASHRLRVAGSFANQIRDCVILGWPDAWVGIATPCPQPASSRL